LKRDAVARGLHFILTIIEFLKRLATKIAIGSGFHCVAAVKFAAAGGGSHGKIEAAKRQGARAWLG